MKILAIESSCDETAVAIVENGIHILSSIVLSQIDIFAAYGGVIPEIAARSHLEAILPAVNQALNSAHLTWDDIDAIAVTHTPGLFGSLLIGTLTARTLAILRGKPLYPIHHLKSHIYSVWLDQSEDPKDIPSLTTQPLPTFPLIALLVSGGHTQLIHMTAHNHFEIIGTTRDDAVGECFDKVAKILGLPYPGGPAISQLATKGDPSRYPLPHPKVDGLDFSFSGLKTAVLRAVQSAVNVPISTPSSALASLLSPAQKADFAASFERTAIDILLEKLALAVQNHPAHSLVIAGGVSANSILRSSALSKFGSSLPVFFPNSKLSGDNAAMVGAAAFFEISTGVRPADPYQLTVSPTSTIA